MAAIGRFAGAIKDLVDLGTRGLHVFHHVGGDLLKLVFGIDAFAHTGLIGDHKNVVSPLRQQFERLQRPGKKMEILNPGHIKTIARKLIDDAVSI